MNLVFARIHSFSCVFLDCLSLPLNKLYNTRAKSSLAHYFINCPNISDSQNLSNNAY